MAEYCRNCGKHGGCAEDQADEIKISLPRRKIKTSGKSADNPTALSENLPLPAKIIYTDAYRQAYIEHRIDDGVTRTKLEKIAHEAASSAVSMKYQKDLDGQWREINKLEST